MSLSPTWPAMFSKSSLFLYCSDLLGVIWLIRATFHNFSQQVDVYCKRFDRRMESTLHPLVLREYLINLKYQYYVATIVSCCPQQWKHRQTTILCIWHFLSRVLIFCLFDQCFFLSLWLRGLINRFPCSNPAVGGQQTWKG